MDIRVKQLEWASGDGITASKEYLEARSIAGTYWVIEGKWGLQHDNAVGAYYPNDEAAKAAAQADYETRIHSALHTGRMKEMGTPIDDPTTTVYGWLLWHHMDAMRKGDGPRREQAFQAAETLRAIWPAETKVWEDLYTPATQEG